MGTISKNRKLDIVFTFLLSLMLAIGAGAWVGYSFTGNTNTFAPGSFETATLNVTGDWYRGSTNLTASLLGVWGALTSTTLDTGQGAYELYGMDQDMLTSSSPTFDDLTSTSLDTGHGANELYDMDQNVLTTSSPTFENLTITDYLNADEINATEFYRQGSNYTAFIETLAQNSLASIQYDADYYTFKEGSYYVSYEARDGSVVENSTDAKVTYNTTRALLTQFGIMQYGPGLFVFSGEAYVQSEGGGGIPDFDNAVIIRGWGPPGASGMDSNATRFQFPAGSDGLIIDMDTNSGQWYTYSRIENIAIHGQSGSEMATCIKVIKGAHPQIHNIYTWYAGAGGVAHINFTNVQDWYMTAVRTNLNINNSIGFLFQNIDGASRGYTEQGAHGLGLNLKSGIPNGAFEGMVDFWLTVPSGSAVLSQLTYINCESMISDNSSEGVGHTGWKFGNGADTAGARAIKIIGSNFEGGAYAFGDRGIYSDFNGKTCKVSIDSSGFASGAGIEFTDTQSHFTFRECEPEPATMVTGSSSAYMYGTDEPTTATGNFKAGVAPYVLAAGLDFIPSGASDAWIEHDCLSEPDAIVLTGAINNAEATNLTVAFSSTNSTHFRVYYKGGGNVGQNTYFYWIALSNIMLAIMRMLMLVP